MIVCADDFGLTDDINRAVIDLVKRGRVSAVSCMVALEHFDPHAFSHLLRFRDRVDVGLHLTLTDIRSVHPLSGHNSLVESSGHFYPFGRLFRKSLRRGVRSVDVCWETVAQLERFQALAGRPPDFMDSHLHVHQF
ncbi:MAG: ChbG/HpnK family deacetylase, partial [bacterium]